MLILLLTLVGSHPPPPDTVRVEAEEFLERVVARSPALVAAEARTEGAARGVDRARAFRNPQFVVTGENFGSTAPVTGIHGWQGLEGQAVLEASLPLGGDRRAAIARARALQGAAAAEHAVAEAEVRAEALRAIAIAERDRRLVAHAAEELAELERFAEALALGAERGRFSAGDAARARLAVVSAVAEEARRRAAAAGSAAEVARLLGLDPATPVAVAIPICSAVPPPTTGAVPLPERALASARTEAAAADVAFSRARIIPDLRPQLGLRRTGGINGLYLGFGFDLPLFGEQRSSLAVARAEHQATLSDESQLTERLEAERVAANAALEILQEAGRHFDQAWRAALEQSVVAARANYELGEGTLMELLDSRRARLAAMDELERWRADVRAARVRATRLSSLPLQAHLLCDSLAIGDEG